MGLGAPVGSVIVGTQAFIDKCRRLRKACGGTMRQAGVLAAAALMAMKEIHPVLHLDHLRMSELAAGLGKLDGVKVQRPVQSNICFVNFVKEIPVNYIVSELRKYKALLEAKFPRVRSARIVLAPSITSLIRVVTPIR